MKRKLSVFIVLLLFCFSAFGLAQVKADATNPVGTSFNFSIETQFGEAEPTVSDLGSKDYGSKVIIDANSYASEGYEFVTYVVNDKVEPALPASNEFIVAEDLDVLALYREDTKYSVLFTDSNQDFLKVEFVDKTGTADATPPSTASLAKPGYVVSTTSPWSGSYDDVTTNLMLFVQYDKTILSSYTLSVENGTGGGSYEYNEVATVTADSATDFQYWLMDGNIVSLQTTYSFTVIDNTTIIAVNAQGDVNTTADSLFIALSSPYSLFGGYDTYVGQFNLPAGNDLVEFGILTYSGDGVFTLDTASGTGVNKYRCDNYLAETGEFMVSLDTSYPANSRAYMITTDGATETVTYSYYNESLIISEVGESSSNKWVELYNPNDYIISSSDYELRKYANGAITAGSSFDLGTISIGAKDVYVLYYGSAEELTSEGDSNAIANFNGNDAIGLYHDGYIIDELGDIGSSAYFCEDLTLTRKIEIFNPNPIYTTSEWNSAATNYDSVGFHNPVAPTTITITGDTSVYVGNSITLDITYPANTIHGVTWDVIIPGIATVDANGVVTGVSEGEIGIVATSTADGSVQDAIMVTVNPIVSYTVSYEENGGTSVADEPVNSGSKATEPADPTKADNTFDGWYTDDVSFANLYDFDTFVTGNITLYAKWIASGTEVLAYSTEFEDAQGFTASSTYNNATEKLFGPTGNQWATYYGTPSTTSEIEGLQSMQCRWYTSAPANVGYARTDFVIADVTKVVFNAKGNDGLDVEVSYSIDNGTTWIGAEIFDLTTSSVQYTYTINATGNVMIKFTLVLPDPLSTSTSEFYLDEVEIYNMN
jgi:uncharacterized repeat protein (TIGR02543 family)